MHRSLGRRILAGVAAASASIVLAAPAYAAGTRFAMVLPDVTVAAGGGVFVDPILYASQDVEVTGAKMTFRLSGGLDGVSLSGPGSSATCTNDGPGTLTCVAAWPVPIGPNGAFTELTAAAFADEAALGETGTVTMTFTADGVAPVTRTVDVTVAEGVDLAAGNNHEVSVRVGDTFEGPLEVHNNSDAVVHGAAVVFEDTDAFAPREHYSNCYYADDRLTACAFDTDLAAGADYRVDVPYRLRPDTYAPGAVVAEFEWLPGDDFAGLLKFAEDNGFEGPGKLGNGRTLRLEQAVSPKALKQTDTNPENNWQQLLVNTLGKNGVDLAAVGASVSGVAGETVTVPVGVHNNGPATLNRRDNGGPAAVVIVTIPTGAKVVTVPTGCHSSAGDGSLHTGKGGIQYACSTTTLLPAGATVLWKFGLRITKAVPDAEGWVEVNPACACDRFDRDTDKSNNTARVVLNPSGGGQGGGLPITGPQTALLAAGGAALVAAGLVGLVLAGRRRTRFQV